MKKKFIYICLLFLLTLSFTFSAKGLLIADNNEISSSSFDDQYLYTYLVNQTSSKTLTKDSLEEIAIDMVDKTDASKGFILDLSYRTVNSSNLTDSSGQPIKFTSIRGLEQLFSSLDPTYKITQINLSGHSLSTVGSYLRYCKDLELLDLSNNNLESIDISTLENIQTLNLAGNNFTTTNNIKLFNTSDASNKRNVYLSYNNILNDELKQTSDTINYNFGLQGVKFNGTYYTNETIAFMSYLPEITKITITKLDENDNLTDNVITLPYLDDENETQYQTTVSYGKYRITFPESENVTDKTYSYLNSLDFEVKVIAPTIKLFQNDIEIELQKYVYEETTIALFGEGEIHIIKDNQDIKANSISITSSGLQRIGYYQIIDGYKSDIEYFTINSKIQTNLQFLYIFLTFIGFALLVLLGYFLYKNVYIKRIINAPNKKEKY